MTAKLDPGLAIWLFENSFELFRGFHLTLLSNRSERDTASIL